MVASAFIIPDDTSGRIITFDAIESELHEGVSEVTDHPVEVGVNISDHIRPLPERVSLTAFVSNTPIDRNPFTQRGEIASHVLDLPQKPQTLASILKDPLQTLSSALFGNQPQAVSVLTFFEEFNAIVETHEVLLELKDNGVVLQVVTGLRTYDDMVLTRVSAPRAAGRDAVSFGLDIRNIRIVESGQVAAPPGPLDSVPGGKPLQQKGGQGAKPPGSGEDASKGGSIAYTILKGQGLL